MSSRIADALILVLAATADAAVRLSCETTVPVSGGVMEIELWPDTSPMGVKRVMNLVNSNYFTDLPFFHALPQMVLFGIQPDAEKQRHWDRMGDIDDDPYPQNTAPNDDGLLFFSGDPGKKANSRSTLLSFTLGGKGLLANRNTPWEIPVGKIVKGMDVLNGIYTGYGVSPIMAWLNSTNINRGPHAPDSESYWKTFPKFDSFRQCKVVRDQEKSGDPNRRRMPDEL